MKKCVSLRHAECCAECKHGTQIDEYEVYCEKYSMYIGLCQVCDDFDI